MTTKELGVYILRIDSAWSSARVSPSSERRKRFERYLATR